MKYIVLASGSPRRKELLGFLGFQFDVCSPDTDEQIYEGEDLITCSKRLAREKAEAVLLQYPDSLILAADTIVAAKDGINSSSYTLSLAKPKDNAEASKMLRILNTDDHLVITGYSLVNMQNGKIVSETSHAIITKVFFANNSSTDIDRYVSSGEPMGKAGGYAIQGMGSFLIEKIEGSYTNVVGLPLVEVRNSIEQVLG